MHLMMEGKNGSLSRLKDQAHIVVYMSDLVRLSGMTAISAPVVRETEGGLVGFQIIAESHISIHTIGRDSWLDVFSCKPLPIPAESIVHFTKEMFGFESVDWNVMERGLEFLAVA